jgi:hypothetical protein
MTKTNKFADCDDNSCYTDGFPVNDNPDKKDNIHSKDPSRPFDSGRTPDERERKKNSNYSGTTMDDPDKYKK